MIFDFTLLSHEPDRKVYRGLHTGKTYDYFCERSQRLAIQFGEAREIKYRDAHTYRPGPMAPGAA